MPYRHFDEVDGLTTKMVYSIIQDKDGFMWFATDAGVFRYDGKTFRHFKVDDGLSDNEILKIFQDRKGRIWFLTLNGYLSFWNNGKIYNRFNAPFLKNAYLGSSVANAYEDGSGKLWIIGLKSGLIVIDDTLVNTTLLPPAARIYGSPFVYEDHDGHMWYFYKSIMVNTTTHDSLNFSGGIFGVSQSGKNGSAFASKPDGIYKIENRNFFKVINAPNLPNCRKIINMIARNDSLWLCTIDEGCYLYSENKLIHRYLENSSVSSTYTDNEGNIWFSTLNDGVYILKKNDLVINYNLNSGLSAEKIISITTGKNKSIWIGYNNGIVDNIIGDKKISFDLKEKSDPDFFRVTTMLYDKDTLWCGTDLACYYIANNIITRVPYWKNPDGKYAVKQITIDNNGTKYACFSLNFLRIQSCQNNLCAFQLLDSVVRNFSSLALDDNKFLISCDYGLMEFSPGNYFREFTSDSSLKYLRILDMKMDDDGLLLLSTNNKGLFVLKNNKIIQNISTDEGLSGNSCGKLCLDNNQLFISSDNGVDILIKMDGKWRIDRVFTKQNGLLSNNVNDIAVDDSKIYLATDQGLSVINRQSIATDVYFTSVKITEIVTDTSQLVNESSYSFKSGIPRLLLRFSYPVFNPMNRTLLKYRLRENSSATNEWNTTANNEVEFSSISPGNYIFEIMPEVKNGVAEITTLHINIIPKWWQTTIAKLLALLVTLLALLITFRLRVKNQYESKLVELKQAGMIESERNRIASDMHDDIGADLTQIAIWLNILKQKELAENKIVQKVSALSKEVLSKMDQIIWALNSMHNSSNELFSYLHSFASESLESSEILLDFKVDDNFPVLKISAFQRRNIFLVIKELLHNTIKHSKARKVSIGIQLEKGAIVINYSDDGKGFLIEEKTDGLGLITMKKRMAEINSEIRTESFTGKGFFCYLSIPINS